MAAKKAAISVSVIADAAKMRAGLAEAEKAAGNLSNQFKTVGKTVASAFATQAIFNFAKGALQAAEAASTSRSRIEQVATSMNIFGDQVGEVTDRLVKLADQTARNTGVDQNQIKLTQAKLLTFKELAVTADEVGGAFDRATMAAIDMAAAGFGEASTNAVQLGKALNDPIKGITALSRSGITFTQQQKDVIQALVDTNQMGEAQALILQAIEEQVGGVAEATANDTDKMRVSFTQLKEEVGQALVPVFAQLLEVVKPIIDAFTSLPEGVQQFVVIGGLALGLTKSLSTTMQGFGLAAKTANLAMGAVGGALVVFSLHSQNAAQNAQRFQTELGNLSRATDDVMQQQFLATVTAAAFAGEFGNAEEFVAKLAQTSIGTVERLRDLNVIQEGLGLTTDDVNRIIGEQVTGFQQAEADAQRHSEAIHGLAESESEAADATEEMNRALDEQERALNAVLTATLAQFNSALAYEDQQWRTKDAIDAYTTAQLDAAFGTLEGEEAARAIAEAQNDAATAALSQAAALAKMAEDQALASGATLTAAESAQIQIEELDKVAQALSPSDPLRKQLEEYIRQLGTIPKDVATQLTVSVQALMNAPQVTAAGGRLTFRAKGGPVSPTMGPYIVGEEGPEVFVPGQTGMILPNTALIDAMAARPTAAGLPSQPTVIVNVQGSVTAEQDLVEKIRRGLVNAQRNGAQLVYSNL